MEEKKKKMLSPHFFWRQRKQKILVLLSPSVRRFLSPVCVFSLFFFSFSRFCGFFTVLFIYFHRFYSFVLFLNINPFFNYVSMQLLEMLLTGTHQENQCSLYNRFLHGFTLGFFFSISYMENCKEIL